MKKNIAITLILSFLTVILAQPMNANQSETYSQPISSTQVTLSQIFTNFDKDNPTPEQQLMMDLIPEDVLDMFLQIAENMNMDNGSISPLKLSTLACVAAFVIAWYVIPWYIGIIVLVYLASECF